MDVFGFICSALILITCFFVRLRIVSHLNPVYLSWLLFGSLPILAAAFTTTLRINFLIYLSFFACFIVFVRFKPHILFTQGNETFWSSVTLSTFVLGCAVFLFPILINIFNQSGFEASDFSERNSVIGSMPIAVVSRSLSSLSFPLLFLARKTCRAMFLLMVLLAFVFSTLTFSYGSSKGIYLLIPFFVATIVFSRQVCNTYSLDNELYKVLDLSRLANSLFLAILHKIFGLRISPLPLVFLSSLLFGGIVTIFTLHRLNFPIAAIMARVAYNFDTLIYLSDSIDRGLDVSAFSSGFLSLPSLYIKPFMGLVGLSESFHYRSAPQFIMSVYSGSYWNSSSLGNSNLIAESIISSNLLIGCLTAPIFYYMYLRFTRLIFKNSLGDPFLLIVAFSLYFNSYAFFSSSQEVVMTSAPLIILFYFRHLRIRNRPRASLIP